MKNQTFASRFSPPDWSNLCGNAEFDAAVAAGEFGVAEVIAHHLLVGNLNFSPVGAPGMSREAIHDAVRQFVTLWAEACGKTGRAGKQSRQAHIRKLMRHGLDSDYARKMAAQAGINA